MFENQIYEYKIMGMCKNCGDARIKWQTYSDINLWYSTCTTKLDCKPNDLETSIM